MGERMKQHEFDEQQAALVRSAERWRYAGRIATEAERARASEDQKGLVIKALADALYRRCSDHDAGCDCGGCAALRLAGRL